MHVRQKIVITESYKIIELSKGLTCKVSPYDYEWLSAWKWYAKKSSSRWYAVRKVHINGKPKLIRMHRLIAGTKGDYVCHHLNGDSLDNRRENLESMMRGLHDIVHYKTTRAAKAIRLKKQKLLTPANLTS